MNIEEKYKAMETIVQQVNEKNKWEIKDLPGVQGTMAQDVTRNPELLDGPFNDDGKVIIKHYNVTGRNTKEVFDKLKSIGLPSYGKMLVTMKGKAFEINSSSNIASEIKEHEHIGPIASLLGIDGNTSVKIIWYNDQQIAIAFPVSLKRGCGYAGVEIVVYLRLDGGDFDVYSNLIDGSLSDEIPVGSYYLRTFTASNLCDLIHTSLQLVLKKDNLNKCKSLDDIAETVEDALLNAKFLAGYGIKIEDVQANYPEPDEVVLEHKKKEIEHNTTMRYLDREGKVREIQDMKALADIQTLEEVD